MTLMEKNWKLCETLVVGIIGTNEIHLADPTQKSYVKEIDKILSFYLIFFCSQNFLISLLYC